MRFLLITIIAFFTIIHSPQSIAGLLVEPILGYSFTRNVSVEDEDYSSGSGPALGGRLGWQKGPFQIGGDFLKSSIDMSSSDFDKDFNTNEYGAFVGFEFPILVRAYAAYILKADGDTEANDDRTNLSGGTGVKIGAGFTLLPFLDLNVDYRKISFDDDVEFDAYMFSVSVPLDLF